MKKPSNLKLNEPVETKRIKGIPANFENRKKKYEELKELRQKLKQKKLNNIQKARKERERLKEKKKRKELNDLKSGSYEIVINK
jgi:hypothetical protein